YDGFYGNFAHTLPVPCGTYSPNDIENLAGTHPSPTAGPNCSPDEAGGSRRTSPNCRSCRKDSREKKRRQRRGTSAAAYKSPAEFVIDAGADQIFGERHRAECPGSS